MSAIWGVIDLDNKEIDKSINIKKEYTPYKIDRYSCIEGKNFEIHCGQQFFTKESLNAKNPIEAVDKNIIFVTDCVLDNREAKSELSDEELLLNSYLKYGDDFVNHVIGAFSVVVYDKNKNEVKLITDHMGNRSLFYYIKNNSLYFSTLIAPLKNALNLDFNEKWITACISNISADMFMYKELTPYDGVLQMQSASILTLNKNGIKSKKYWSEKNYSKIKINVENAKEIYISTIDEATKSMMRSIGETACTLSGGLDSSTVASFAAPELEKRNKKLFSFTSIPLKGYVSEDKTEIADESKYVEDICSMYSNIEPTFVSCENKDAFTELERLVKLIGYPMKSGLNLAWLDEIYSRASENNCKLLLKGQYGNSTISYGTAFGCVYQLLKEARFVTAKKVAAGFCKRYGVPKKAFINLFIKEYRNKFLKEELDSNCILSKSKLINKYELNREYQRLIKEAGGGIMDSFSQREKFIFNEHGLQQLGMFDTAISLIHGVLVRDSLKDKRVVEMVLSMPKECLLAGNVERGMARTFMAGRVPESILGNIWARGVQSSDSSYRTRLMWDNNKDKVLTRLNNSLLLKYAEPQKLEELLIKLDNKKEQIEETEFREANVLYALEIMLEGE